MAFAVDRAPSPIGKPAANVCNASYITSLPCERAACADDLVFPAAALGFKQVLCK